jgi:hypothetical protein
MMLKFKYIDVEHRRNFTRPLNLLLPDAKNVLLSMIMQLSALQRMKNDILSTASSELTF